MFTLKVQMPNMRDPSKPQMMWLPGVRRIVVLDHAKIEDALGSNETDVQCPPDPLWLSYMVGRDFQRYTDGTARGTEIALVHVIFDEIDESVAISAGGFTWHDCKKIYATVERAWLIGPGGETIDRVWP